MIRFTLILFALLFTSEINAQKKIATPIAGTYGEDYIIVNHVDWGILDTVKDLHCGTKSYNGHQGTDFNIRNFKQMDSGVAVLAADTGTVTFIQDGLFDKETTSVISKGLGNYIAIAHSGKFYSYYGHLKKNSILVKEGDQVVPGQKIAEIGSSGNSTDPHLHFEWWFDSSIVIDPFSGPCGNAYNYWTNPAPYDTSFNIWMSGLFNDTLNINDLRNEPSNIDTFFHKKDSFISYWNLMYGLRKNDVVKIEWYTPAGTPWFEYETAITQDHWYYYYWSYIQVPSTGGKWKMILRRNGTIVNQKEFVVEKTQNIINPKMHSIFSYINDTKLEVKNAEGYSVDVYIINGLLIQSENISSAQQSIDITKLPSSIIILRFSKDGETVLIEKKVVN